ncbi:hypothetical protein Lal_00031369 [Lupinus albus]|nr:hypothetical protein Lal_00031369 [Lupinus albus]
MVMFEEEPCVKISLSDVEGSVLNVRANGSVCSNEKDCVQNDMVHTHEGVTPCEFTSSRYFWNSLGYEECGMVEAIGHASGIWVISARDVCGLMDIGAIGSRFIWFRRQLTGRSISKKLDGGLSNNSWRTSFLEGNVENLTNPHSDHCSLLVRVVDRFKLFAIDLSVFKLFGQLIRISIALSKGLSCRVTKMLLMGCLELEKIPHFSTLIYLGVSFVGKDKLKLESSMFNGDLRRLRIMIWVEWRFN